ncbi:MAG: aspartyl/asparaginyl beta-hydroxylase domain-containing protein [Bacteroidetes bacterium]|nr:aspartyl/asparaginyl beta-hydroxylase domain-containing protein [Bacteroidota bacterium]MCB9225555.1 aspartyl/asparaginyl beta-hydroxylase domain-containing protein [Chitinophagales bacterium]
MFSFLNKYLEETSHAYGHEMPLFVKDFLDVINDIKKEYNTYLLSNEIKPIDEMSDAQKDLNTDKNWRALFLYGYEYYNHKAIIDFPSLKKLVEKHKNTINLVMFSTLEPGKEILPHYGKNIGVLRIQIGLDIPEPALCGLQVEDKVFHLKNNEVLVFDDTFKHAAWNRGNKDRTLLIIDYKKPLSFPFNILNNLYQKKIKKSAYIQQVLKKL